jgi:preprotein translocase subunit SecD
MDSATEVVRRRIDELGTREPTIIRQGDTRIVVQVPGLQDPEALKEPARPDRQLEFKLVDPRRCPRKTCRRASRLRAARSCPMRPAARRRAASLRGARLGGIRGDS